MSSAVLSALRREAREAPDSGIVEVFNYGRGREGLIPLWAGEGDLPTPDFICDAAARSLRAGETFYTWQRGLPELRAALARYHARQFGREFEPERFFVTGGGMQAIQIAIAATAGAGDEVIVPTPAWPNFAAAVGIGGARPVSVPLDFDGTRWSLDLDRLFAAAGRADARDLHQLTLQSDAAGRQRRRSCAKSSASRASAGSGSSPTRSTAASSMTAAPRAPSFYDLIEADDRVIFVNTFSKNWAMTGWRIGWLSAPPALGDVIENLIQYSTSGVAAFMQRAAIAAIEEGEDFVRFQVARAAAGRSIVCEGLAGSNRVRFAWPDGRLLSLLHGRRRARHPQARADAGRRGEYRRCPRQRLRAGRGGVHATLLRAQGRGFERGDAASSRLAWKLMPAFARPSLATVRRFAITLALSAGGGLLFQSLGMPAGWISGGLLAVAIASLSGFDSEVPQPIRAPVYLVLGLYAGGGVSQQTIHQMATWPLSFAILGVSLVALIASSYWWLHTRCGWDRNAALLASLPGALSFVMAAAEGLKADLKTVAIAQSLRLLILVEGIPIVALVIGHPAPAAVTGAAVSAGFWEIVILLAVGLVAALVLQRLQVVGGWMLGGLLASSGLLLSGVVHARLPFPLVLPFVITLAAITGSRFRPGDIWILPRILKPALIAFVPGYLHFRRRCGLRQLSARREFHPDTARLRARRTRCADHSRLSDERRSGLCRRASCGPLLGDGDRRADSGALA